MLKGALHIHSTYSDGEFTLAELRDLYAAAGCRFICVTDHAQYFDAESVRKYSEECTSLSEDRLLMIPGLEFSCTAKMHILGYGVTELSLSSDPQEIIAHIERCGGISVIAHPRERSFATIESFTQLPDGIETWNSKYDGRYAPRPGVFELLHKLQRKRPEMLAFYGQDLHWKNQYRGLLNVVRNGAPDRREILTGLAKGDYFAVKDGLSLPSDGQIPETLMQRFATVHRRSEMMRTLIRGTKKQADRMGLTIPASVKARLRKIF